jgi:hypothetical protein
LLALNGKIDESLFRDQVGIIVMFRVLEIDEIPSLESENPNPLELRIAARLIIFFHAGVNTSPAANAARKLQAVSPKGVRDGILGANLEFSSILLQVSLLKLCNDLLLFIRGHFAEMLLQEVLGFFLGTR